MVRIIVANEGTAVHDETNDLFLITNLYFIYLLTILLWLLFLYYHDFISSHFFMFNALHFDTA